MKEELDAGWIPGMLLAMMEMRFHKAGGIPGRKIEVFRDLVMVARILKKENRSWMLLQRRPDSGKGN